VPAQHQQGDTAVEKYLGEVMDGLKGKFYKNGSARMWMDLSRVLSEGRGVLSGASEGEMRTLCEIYDELTDRNNPEALALLQQWPHLLRAWQCALRKKAVLLTAAEYGFPTVEQALRREDFNPVVSAPTASLEALAKSVAIKGKLKKASRGASSGGAGVSSDSSESEGGGRAFRPRGKRGGGKKHKKQQQQYQQQRHHKQKRQHQGQQYRKQQRQQPLDGGPSGGDARSSGGSSATAPGVGGGAGAQ